MKKITLIGLITIVFIGNLVSQAPNLMSYQAVIWDGSGNLVAEKTVSIKISILQGSVTGTSVYSETHRVQTNVNGLVSLMIGGGTNLSGKISDINWGGGSFFLKTETDPTGGSNYIITGTTQLVSVPYALHSNTSNNLVTPKPGLPGQILTADKDGKPIWVSTLPTLSTTNASNIQSNSAESGGNVISDGGSPITARGVVWSTFPNPTISLSTSTNNGTGLGIFTSALNWLTLKTTYYVRAYATNSLGTAYGNEITFTTKSDKNYQISSYELEKSDITIDLVNLRREFKKYDGFILAIAYLDVNNDGFDDIFLNPGSGNDDRTICELYVSKDGGYVLDNSYFNKPSSLVHARKALVGDYNKDGKPDIFIAGHGYDRPPFPGEYTQLLISNNSGKYDLKTFETKVGFYHAATSGDIDNDGDLDIFVLGGTQSYFLINDGKGNFTISTNQIDINKLGGHFHCEFIDIDKDGFLDLLLGGHEFESDNTTEIFWGSTNLKFTNSNKSQLPEVDFYGVITDLDVTDLDSDGINEIIVTRTGGKLINNETKYFYSGWYIQVVKLNNRIGLDVTDKFIDKNILTYSTPNPWITWMRFGDYDKNGKIDFFSTRCGGADFVRWELQNKKLVRITN